MNITKIKNHITELQHKHEHLQHELNEAINSHQSDQKVAELKKEKLRIKDEIDTCTRKLHG